MRSINQRVMVGPSRTHGLGLFAGRAFAKGDVIYVEPALIVPLRQLRLKRPNIVQCYGFEWKGSRIALGSTTAFANHDEDPNARAFVEAQGRGLVTISLVARRKIAKYDELTIHYADEPGEGFAFYYERTKR